MPTILDQLGLGDSGNSGDSSVTPESIAQRRRLAEALLQQGQADTPIRHWSQGANRVLQSMLGTYRLGQLDKQDQAGTAAANSQLASVFGGGAAPASSPAITPAAPAIGAPATPAQGAAPADGQRLPMGMRVNNPGNIKYNPRLGYAGMIGPSKHTDQGDPQMTFDTPQNGMNAAARLALTKYARGQTTAASIVAGEGGWTPGNTAAAANIARTMGVAPDEDLRLSDPARMSTFLQALTMQEHGPASRQYTPEMYETAATAVGGPAAAAPSAAPRGDTVMPPSGASNLQRMAVELMKNPRNAPLGRELLIKAALAEAPKQPEAVQEYTLAVKQGYAKPFMDYQIEMKQAGQPRQAPYEFTKYGIGDKFSGEVKPYAAGNADPELTLEQSKHEQSLRKEYTTLSSDMRTIQDSVGKLHKGRELDSGAGDIGIVYAYMKMLDPASVVREGEYGTAEQVGGAAEKFLGLYNRLVKGERLTPVQRDQFVTAGEGFAGEKAERFGKLKSQFEGIARKSGADPNRIMLDEGMAVTPPPPGGAPKGAPVQIKGDADYDALPSGTEFIDPDGQPRRKP